jgi:NodT family efflux transporter outer membrane factor (OMF) lipoprotein
VAFKEASGWKVSEPRDERDRGPWWRVYNDPVLDELAQRVATSNQNVRAFEAAYRQATALLQESRARFLPAIGATGSVTRSDRGRNATTQTGTGTTPATVAAGPTTQYSTTASGSWELDVWGRIRRTVEGDRANAEASGADLAAATLAAQAQLITAYFDLRVQDEFLGLFERTAAAYAESLQIAQNKYAAGVVSKADIVQAETQLRSVQAQAMSARLARAQLEHGIAILVGEAPAGFTLAAAPFTLTVPDIPVGVPSALLERRPDVAAAERRVAAANADIGVAISGFFPDVTVTGSYGSSSSTLDGLFSAGTRFWSVGPQLALTLFDAGARSAQVRRARAGYDQQVASYRQTVLTALQEVEDQLSAISILAEQSAIQAEAVRAAEEAQRIIANQYRAGIVEFETLASAQASAANARQAALNVQRNRLAATVSLIQALGGGWSTEQLALK